MLQYTTDEDFSESNDLKNQKPESYCVSPSLLYKHCFTQYNVSELYDK